MKLFIIISTVVACSYAAATFELLHPSPVNPDVLVAIKPEEKVILITDPKEIAKFKRETNKPLYPTVLPNAQDHHIEKREHKETEIENNSHDEKNDEHYTNLKVLPLHLEELSPATEQHKRDIPVPLVPKYYHPEESSTENSKIETDTNRTTENLEQRKVDDKELKSIIPDPSVPHHPESAPVDFVEPHVLNQKPEQHNEKRQTNLDQIQILSKTENGKQNPVVHNVELKDGLVSKPSHHVISTQYDTPNIQYDHLSDSQSSKSTEHPLARPHPVPVAELFSRGHGN